MPELHSPLAGILAPGRFGAAPSAAPQGASARLVLGEQAPGSLVQIAGWQGFETASEPLLSHLGCAAPADFRTAEANSDGTRHVFRLAPDRLLVASDTPPDWPGELTPPDRLAILDVTHARWIIAVSGPALEDLLHRLAPIDFREEQMPAGTFVQTAINKVSVLVWRTAPDHARILCPTASTRWLWAYVTDVAAPLGFEVRAA